MIFYQELGYDGFLTRGFPITQRLSSLDIKGGFPLGSLSAALISSPLNATTDITFSSTDNDTAAWTAGTIYFADGTKTDAISAGNTGNISATTYIYYDKDQALTLKTTTDHSVAVGPTKLLIAIVEAGASGKDCKITPTIAAGLTVSGITASQITADTITASEIAASTITANEISGNQLDVVATNTGTLNVDETIDVGDSNIIIDGGNNRIVLYNSAIPEVVIGEV